jgi:hypothetical protein
MKADGTAVLNKQQKNNVYSVVNGEVYNVLCTVYMKYILNLIHSENVLNVNIETLHDCV